MTLLIKLILIYFIIINIYFFNKKKRELMGFDHWGHFIKSFLTVSSFILFFLIFIRLLNLFRESRILDLKIIIENFDLSFLILCFICLWLVRKNLMFIVKLNFLKIHYFGSINFLPQNPYSECYNNFYENYVFRISNFFYNKTYWLDKIFTFVMLILIAKDLLFNNMILDSCLGFAPWYSVFKFCFICTRFVAIKQNSFLDYYLSCMCYAHTGYISDDAPFYKGSNDSWRNITMKVLEYEKEIIRI